MTKSGSLWQLASNQGLVPESWLVTFFLPLLRHLAAPAGRHALERVSVP
jgi:hypothetical protein